LPDVTTTISPALAHLKNTCARDKERQAPKEPTSAGVGATCLSVGQLNRKCRHPHKYDDIQAVLLEQFGDDCLFLDRQMFLKHCEHEAKTFKPPGKLIKEFTRQSKVVSKASDLFGSMLNQPQKPDKIETITLKVYKVTATQANFKAHDRHLQALLKFYIESASFILPDNMWNYFLVYIDNKLAAYATTYEEYRKVPKAPVTISQVLVLPPY